MSASGSLGNADEEEEQPPELVPADEQELKASARRVAEEEAASSLPPVPVTVLTGYLGAWLCWRPFMCGPRLCLYQLDFSRNCSRDVLELNRLWRLGLSGMFIFLL